MKITKEDLVSIIKEELESYLKETGTESEAEGAGEEVITESRLAAEAVANGILMMLRQAPENIQKVLEMMKAQGEWMIKTLLNTPSAMAKLPESVQQGLRSLVGAE